MDEAQRDLYNRFGEKSLNFDPRKDELKILSDIAYQYVYFFILLYVLSISESTRAMRTWGSFLLIGMIITEVTLSLTETTLPVWMPFNMTEKQFMLWIYQLFPVLLLVLQCLAEWLYVDVNYQCSLLLQHILVQQKVRVTLNYLSLTGFACC